MTVRVHYVYIVYVYIYIFIYLFIYFTNSIKCVFSKLLGNLALMQ